MTLQLTTSRTFLVLLWACSLAACQIVGSATSRSTGPTALPPPSEVEVQEIPLIGPASSRSAEISGMAWYGDTLVLLPQYPGRFGKNGDGVLFTLARIAITDFLASSSASAIEPGTLRFLDGGLHKEIRGFEGFESIAFEGESVYLTIEASPGSQMKGYIVSGRIQPDRSEIRLDPATLKEIPLQEKIKNFSDESLLIFEDELITLYEANGKKANPTPVAHQYDKALQLLGTLPFPTIEFRITDVAPPDQEGYFWAINAYFPSDEIKLKPQNDLLAERYGLGKTHLENLSVERLVQFQIMENEISLVAIPPVQLRLEGDVAPRNWEALALLDSRGFLIATDKFPRTILGFIPFALNEIGK